MQFVMQSVSVFTFCTIFYNSIFASFCLSVCLSLSLCLSLFLSLSLSLSLTNVSSSSVLFAVFKNPHVLSNLYARVIQHVYTCYSTYMHVISTCVHMLFHVYVRVFQPCLEFVNVLFDVCARVIQHVCRCNRTCVHVLFNMFTRVVQRVSMCCACILYVRV